MFDIGFFELLLIAVVALLVIGPERLPTVARTAGLWLGKGRRMLQSVKADIDRELKAEELKRILEEQAKSTPAHEILDDARSLMDGVKQEAESVVKSAGEQQDSSAAESKPDKPTSNDE